MQLVGGSILGICAIALGLGLSTMATSMEEPTTVALRADVVPGQSPKPSPTVDSLARTDPTARAVARTRPIDPFRAKVRASERADVQAELQAERDRESASRDEARAQAREAQAKEASDRKRKEVERIAEVKRSEEAKRREQMKKRERAKAVAAHAKAVAAKKEREAREPETEKSSSDSSEPRVSSGSSAWRGRVLRPPHGGSFPASVLRWAELVRKVMVEHKIPERNLEGILAQIQRESMGQPNVVNNSDSNAARGTPSKGLLQIIAPTYRTNAKQGYGDLKYQTVPYTNIWAALNYVKRSYGMGKFASWSAGNNGGY